MRFAITFGFEKVGQARVELGGKFCLQFFQTNTVRKKVGWVGSLLGGDRLQILLQGNKEKSLGVGEGHSERLQSKGERCPMLESAGRTI